MSKNPRKKWEKGLPLKDAYIDYFGFPNHENNKKAKETRFNYFILGKDAEPGEYDADNPETYRYTPQAKQHRLKLQNDFRNQLCISFAQQLKVGNLVALGIRFNFEGDREYAEIPIQQIKTPKIDDSDELKEADIRSGGIRKICESWDKNIFYGLTKKYEQVRIHDPRYNLDGSKKKTVFSGDVERNSTPNFDKSGRPSKEKIIRSAFERCAKQNSINFSGKQKDAVTVIREFIEEEFKEHWDNGAGFSRQTITKHIKDLFNQLKSDLKNL